MKNEMKKTLKEKIKEADKAKEYWGDDYSVVYWEGDTSYSVVVKDTHDYNAIVVYTTK